MPFPGTNNSGPMKRHQFRITAAEWSFPIPVVVYRPTFFARLNGGSIGAAAAVGMAC